MHRGTLYYGAIITIIIFLYFSLFWSPLPIQPRTRIFQLPSMAIGRIHSIIRLQHVPVYMDQMSHADPDPVCRNDRILHNRIAEKDQITMGSHQEERLIKK